ncbi:Heat shock 70 kDa protein [Stygiomarasmius scandens]|uniref:Heat shock 70 kDa protein n=1 Tax=Marasmiellus scandens TaxID=2682957 RepID=A0ABR1J3N1_9AGAR
MQNLLTFFWLFWLIKACLAWDGEGDIGKVVGIELGPSHARVGLKVPNGTGVRIMEGAHGRRSVPTKICFLQEGIFIGHDAEENEVCANKTISNLLQLVVESSVQPKVVGPEDSEDSVILDSDKQQPLTAEEEHTQASNSVKYFPAIVNGAEKHLSLEEILAFFFAGIKVQAEAFYNDTISQAILAVPPYANDYQRATFRSALSQANITALRLFNEPAAVLRAYGLLNDPGCCSCSPSQIAAQRNEDKNLLVYDLREDGKFEATVYFVEDNIPEMLVTTGSLTNTGHGLEGLTESSINRTIEISREAVETAEREEKYFKGGIHEILLSGEASSNPLVRQLLPHAFPGARIPSIPHQFYQTNSESVLECSIPDVHSNPAEAIVIGTALYAAVFMEEPRVEDMCIHYVVPVSLGIEVDDVREGNEGKGGIFLRVVWRNSIPGTPRKARFNMTKSQQTIRVFQGEGPSTNHSFMRMFGELDLSPIRTSSVPISGATDHHKDSSPSAEFEVTMTVDWDYGALSVEIKNLESNRTVSASILPPEVDQLDIERMVFEAEEFAALESLRAQLEVVQSSS